MTVKTSVRSRWTMGSRGLRAILAALAIVVGGGSLSGCPNINDLASFLGADFGDVTTTVTDLRDDQLASLMDDVVLKMRLYMELREAITFGDLAQQQCMVAFHQPTPDTIVFVQDANCLFGDRVAPADGFIEVRQQQIAVAPVEVISLDVDYQGVRLGEFVIEGREDITETLSDDGASVRTLDLTQNGVALDYEFRLGLVDGEVPVFDYVIEINDGSVRVRITNPTQPGGLASAQIVGIDGVLLCEVRDTRWSPAEPARGLCDNGQVFGLD